MGYEYHFSGSKTSVSKDEPHFLTKFKVTFVLPPALQAKYNTAIMTEQLQKVGGLAVDRMPGIVEQFYRSIKRRFVGTVAQDGDALDLECAFAVNVDKDGQMYPYNILRDWAKLCYDARTGFQLLKRDYTGQITIEATDKVGTILHKFYAPIVFPITPLNQFDYEYKTEAMYELACTFAAENWVDLKIGDPE